MKSVENVEICFFHFCRILERFPHSIWVPAISAIQVFSLFFCRFSCNSRTKSEFLSFRWLGINYCCFIHFCRILKWFPHEICWKCWNLFFSFLQNFKTIPPFNLSSCHMRFPGFLFVFLQIFVQFPHEIWIPVI